MFSSKFKVKKSLFCVRITNLIDFDVIMRINLMKASEREYTLSLCSY